MEWSEVGWSEVEWNGMEWNGIEWNANVRGLALETSTFESPSGG